MYHYQFTFTAGYVTQCVPVCGKRSDATRNLAERLWISFMKFQSRVLVYFSKIKPTLWKFLIGKLTILLFFRWNFSFNLRKSDISLKKQLQLHWTWQESNSKTLSKVFVDQQPILSIEYEQIKKRIRNGSIQSCLWLV